MMGDGNLPGSTDYGDVAQLVTTEVLCVSNRLLGSLPYLSQTLVNIMNTKRRVLSVTLDERQL
jgi:hypothetical protein